MAKKARLQGSARNYRIRGAIWDLGSFAYRAYVHVVPMVPRSNLPRWVLSADGMSLQEVLGAAKARVNSTIGTPWRGSNSYPGRHRRTSIIQRCYDNGPFLDAILLRRIEKSGGHLGS